MKILNLKLISILLVLIYCLAPLTAVDLNQNDTNDNNQSIDNNTSAIEDVKIVENSDDEIKSADKQKNKIQTRIVENPKITIQIDDVERGQPIFIEINAKSHFSEKVTVYLSGNPSRANHIDVEEGYGSAYIDSSDLNEGFYSAVVFFYGNDNFTDSMATTSFHIKAPNSC